MAITIFLRIAGSAHRALAASRILSRRAGSASAARNFAPVIGSAHRALAAARYLSRISGVGSDRELSRVRLIPLDRRKKWAVASRGASAQGLVWSGPKTGFRIWLTAALSKTDRPSAQTIALRTFSERGARAMKPLYDAQVEDLGPDDRPVVECACGHLEDLMGAMLLTADVPSYTPVLDLKRKLKCRECRWKGQADVSIKWAR